MISSSQWQPCPFSFLTVAFVLHLGRVRLSVHSHTVFAPMRGYNKKRCLCSVLLIATEKSCESRRLDQRKPVPITFGKWVANEMSSSREEGVCVSLCLVSGMLTITRHAITQVSWLSQPCDDSTGSFSRKAAPGTGEHLVNLWHTSVLKEQS